MSFNLRSLTKVAVQIGLLTVLLFVYNNCGVIVQPGVEDMDLARVKYVHSGFETSCVECHEKDRPAPASNGLAHGGGGDCKGCHTQTSWRGGLTNFSHSPTPASCIDCHLRDRPAGVSGAKNFDHANGGTGDCVMCHARTAGSTWAGGDYTHSPAPRECTSCHLSRRPTGLVGTPPFNHATAGMGECALCHKSPGVTWRGATFNHTPLPTSCNSCHSSARPATARYPGSNTPVNGHYTAKDCYACHRPPPTGSTVRQFSFAHSNAANQDINFCLPCHLQDGRNQHTGDNRVMLTGDGNCYNCHRTRRSWNR